MKKTSILTASSLAGAIALAAFTLSGNNASGQKMPMNHQGMAGMGTPKGDQSPSSAAYAEANAKMHAGMDIEFTGDADVDFAAGMIPHHEGAVAMAKIVLEHGDDPEIRKLAEAVVAAQESEIVFMREWLAKNAK